MLVLVDREDFAAVVGIDWYRWYVGVSYETPPGAKAAVLRFGPLYLHLITRL